jgi:hypothetical protein
MRSREGNMRPEDYWLKRDKRLQEIMSRMGPEDRGYLAQLLHRLYEGLLDVERQIGDVRDKARPLWRLHDDLDDLQRHISDVRYSVTYIDRHPEEEGETPDEAD